MNNLTYLIGRLVEEPNLKTTENGKEVLNCTVAVGRDYKNVDGIYECDFINCTLWNGIAARTAEYCKKGDLIAFRGQIRSKQIETKSGDKVSTSELVVDKVSFISPKKEVSKDEIDTDSIFNEDTIDEDIKI